MALSSDDRLRVWRGLMRYASSLFDSVNLSSSELLSAIVETDIWIDSNQASYNSALPAVAQSNLTLAQKTLLFCAVATARVSINLLRKILGEVD